MENGPATQFWGASLPRLAPQLSPISDSVRGDLQDFGGVVRAPAGGFRVGQKFAFKPENFGLWELHSQPIRAKQEFPGFVFTFCEALL